MPPFSFHRARFLHFLRLGRSSGQHSPQSQHRNGGMFNEARDFSVTGNFIEGNVGSIIYNNATSNQFMKEFLKETIPGAAFDSSARDPPPRCHPGTRLAIIERCINFIRGSHGEKKMRWVVGAAGVGKSAIMQSIAESPELAITPHASVFLSVIGRNDGTKTITTLSYQFAAKSELYRQLIEQEITRDPSLLQSSMAVQFNKFIVEPFIYNSQLNATGRIVAIIDGLDECDDVRTQQELLRLVSDFCITYPSSPLVWLIASRPEPHLTSFFSNAKVIAAYEKEEILVDSDEAREDVERFLRYELTRIKEVSDSLNPHPQWPEERTLWKIANAAGGLFAYADTATKYVGDSTIGDPTSQLSSVLHVIDNHPMVGVPREEHPMALLDALYARILFNVPSKIMINTRKLLLQLATDWGRSLKNNERHFIILCNWLALTPDEAYAAIKHLRSVLCVPRRDEAHENELRPFHKSFIDYVFDFSRSGFSHNIIHEVQQYNNQFATFGILQEAPDGVDVDVDETNYIFGYGGLKRRPGIGDKISLTWLADEGGDWNDDKTRLSLYKLAVGEVAAGMEREEPIFQSEICIRLLTSQLTNYGRFFPRNTLCDLVFNESRRQEFLEQGILKQIPLKAVGVSELVQHLRVNLQFRCPATISSNFSDPWNSSCDHEREGKWDKGKDQDWMTTFDEMSCNFCFGRLKNQLDNWMTQYPDHTVTILFTSTGRCPIEIRFVDAKDSTMSEWTYRAWYKLRPRVRQEYGSTV